MPIQDLARTEVISASPETTVPELANQMHEENVGSVIITNDNHPVGIVTDRDLAMRVVANGNHPNDHNAEDVMSSDLCLADENEGFYGAAEMMSENGVRRLPICNDEGELTGIITADDLSELLADEHQQLASVIQSQRPPY